MKPEQISQIVNGSTDMLDEISRQEVYRRLQDKSLTVVDVLPRAAYLGGHIPRAINLPLAEVSSRAQEVLPRRDAEMAVYCASAT